MLRPASRAVCRIWIMKLKNMGPGEIIRLRADGMEQMRKQNEGMQICSFCGCIMVSRFLTMKVDNVEKWVL